MWLFLIMAGVALAEDDPVSPAARARADVQRAEEQAAAGLVPAMKIAEAQQALDDALDEEILNRTLYGQLAIENLSERQADEMVTAAERRVTRYEDKADRGKKLIAAGVAEPYMFADVEAELARRKQALDQAKARAGLVREIVELARAETAEAPRAVEFKPKEFVDGEHILEAKDIRDLTLAFEKKFHEPLPVSARGQTEVHRAMGFDHTGRIDVALAPDAPEGVWLRSYLESKSIPYYAFRVAMAGKATAPHIHIGPGSTRIHTTD